VKRLITKKGLALAASLTMLARVPPPPSLPPFKKSFQRLSGVFLPIVSHVLRSTTTTTTILTSSSSNSVGGVVGEGQC